MLLHFKLLWIPRKVEKNNQNNSNSERTQSRSEGTTLRLDRL